MSARAYHRTRAGILNRIEREGLAVVQPRAVKIAEEMERDGFIVLSPAVSPDKRIAQFADDG